MYIQIFLSNILRIAEERKMTMKDLALKASVSNSFLSDLINGKANPSLKVMESIARALETPLPILLDRTDLSSKDLAELADGLTSGLPLGYERTVAILPPQKAFIVRQWDEEARKKLREIGY